MTKSTTEGNESCAICRALCARVIGPTQRDTTSEVKTALRHDLLERIVTTPVARILSRGSWDRAKVREWRAFRARRAGREGEELNRVHPQLMGLGKAKAVAQKQLDQMLQNLTFDRKL